MSRNTNRLQSLIAYLILHADTPQLRDQLAFILWPASQESQARTNLRQLLYNLTRALPAECTSLVIDHFAVQWRQDSSCAVDAIELQAAIADAAAGRAEKDRPREIQSLTIAADCMKTNCCLPSKLTSSRPCAKGTGGESVVYCTVSPHCINRAFGKGMRPRAAAVTPDSGRMARLPFPSRHDV